MKNSNQSAVPLLGVLQHIFIGVFIHVLLTHILSNESDIKWETIS
jgi:hypothetical protein